MRHGCSLLTFAIGLAAGSLQAQAVIEGTVQLPKPSFDRGLNQRYAASNDVPMAPSNPPTAVVYREGDLRSQPANSSKGPVQMARLEHLPAGKYVLKAWVAGDDTRERPVELKAGMTLHVDFPAK